MGSLSKAKAREEFDRIVASMPPLPTSILVTSIAIPDANDETTRPRSGARRITPERRPAARSKRVPPAKGRGTASR